MLKDNSKLKIGLICDDTLDKTDGVQQYVLCLGKWLKESAGHEVHYLTSHTERTDIKNIHSLSKNIAVRFNSNRGGMPLPAAYKNIKSLLDKEKFDVLHVQMPYSPLLAGQIILAAHKETAIIGTFHIFPQSQIVSYATHALGFLLKLQLKKFDKFISVSTAAQEFAEQSFHIESEVIPNMVDVKNFSSTKNPTRGKNVKIVFLGRLVERKGVGYLLKAIEFLGRQYKTNNTYELIIGGKGPLFESLDQYVIDHNLKNVQFTGFISEKDKPSFLASADIAVLPSTGGESFGISLIEAMAATKGAVLAGDNPGYRTVMQGSKNQLFDPLDTPAFAHLLASYIDDPKRREKAHRWQAKHVKQFDINTVAPQILSKYIEALRNLTK